MITLEHAIAFALRDKLVMDQLSDALQSDLVVANSYYRAIVQFADRFMIEHGTLPGPGDWQVWIDSVEAGVLREGSLEALQRLWAVNLSGFNPAYFAEQAIGHLRTGAAQVARARVNTVVDPQPEMFEHLAEQLAAIKPSTIQGLARLNEVDVWMRSTENIELIPSGFPRLDGMIGGFGPELWIVFADSGKGKSMLLQNFATAAALRGKRVLHVTLELGLVPQIHRYYRQLAGADRADFHSDSAGVKKRLQHWFRMAQGEIYIMEFPAYSLDPVTLQRIIERMQRHIGQIDVLVLDYLDLLSVPKGDKGRSVYEDLGRLTHMTRGYCTKFGMTVLTASQAVKKPENKERLTVRDMGDSYHKVRGADGLLSLVQTVEEYAVNEGRIGVLKVRDSGGWGAEIPVYINRDLAIIADLDHPNTRALRLRLKDPRVTPLTALTTP